MEDFEKQLMSKTFQENVWRRRAQIYKSALTSTFEDFSKDDMLKLSQDDYFFSKIILFDNAWQVLESEPEFDFTNSKGTWTLLVHDLDKYFLSIHNLLKSFKQFPAWCLEDVMGSYSQEGSVAPAHIDNYDVFIIQLEGKRLWKVDYAADPDYHSDVAVRILKDFNPTEDYELHAGDILYLPAGCAHEGTSLSDSLSLSV
jgi:50S ribosomal protein L16 3-hydroxylase